MRKNVQYDLRKNVQHDLRKSVQYDMRKNVQYDMRKNVQHAILRNALCVSQGVLLDDENVYLQVLAPALAFGVGVNAGNQNGDTVEVGLDDLGGELVREAVVLVVGELVLAGVNQDQEGRRGAEAPTGDGEFNRAGP